MTGTVLYFYKKNVLCNVSAARIFKETTTKCKKKS